MKMTPAQEHAEFMRRMYAAEVEHTRKMRAIAKFLTFYALAGALVTAGIAIIHAIR